MFIEVVLSHFLPSCELEINQITMDTSYLYALINWKSKSVLGCFELPYNTLHCLHFRIF